MLLKLSLLLSTIGIIACNVPFDTTKEVKYEEINQIHQRNYQHSEYLNSYTEVVYKYETNEVNSVDDLVVGNVYTFNTFTNRIDDILTTYGHIFFRLLSNLEIDYNFLSRDDNTTNFDFFSSNYFLDFSFDGVDSYISVYYSEEQFTSFDYSINYFYDGTFLNNCIIQYLDGSGFQNVFSSTDYNEIESIIYHQPQTVVGVINEFCETYLFSEIPYINSMIFEVGGQNINLMTYLIIIVGICVAIGLLILFFFLMKWLVCFFAALFKLRR